MYEPNLRAVLILSGPRDLSGREYVVDVNQWTFSIMTMLYGECVFSVRPSSLGSEGYVAELVRDRFGRISDKNPVPRY